jgi:hypothetical protein
LVAKPARPQKILVKGARGPGEPSLRAAIAEANAMLTEMKVPPRFEIDVTGGSQDIYYLYEDFRIVLPAEFADDFSKGTEKAKRSFLQHEYGHAVFDENFAEYSTEWRNWLSDAKDRGPFSQGTRAPYPRALHRLSAPYQELFADLLAVAAQGDGQAISGPLHRLASPLDPRVRMRDFGGSAFHARWSEPEVVVGEFGPIYGADPLLASPEKLRKLSDDHLTFAPVRAYLWENYFSRADHAAKKPEMLKIVFQTIAEEILLRHSEDALAKLPFPAASARLLRALDKSLAGYQLK